MGKMLGIDLENPTHAPIFTEFKTTVKRNLES